MVRRLTQPKCLVVKHKQQNNSVLLYLGILIITVSAMAIAIVYTKHIRLSKYLTQPKCLVVKHKQ
jgi:hypothetical protein